MLPVKALLPPKRAVLRGRERRHAPGLERV